MIGWMGQKRLLLAGGCALGAVALLIAALMGQEEPGDGKWVPMNEAMAELLSDSGEQGEHINERLANGGNANAGDVGGESVIGKGAEAKSFEGKGVGKTETDDEEGNGGGTSETEGDAVNNGAEGNEGVKAGASDSETMATEGDASSGGTESNGDDNEFASGADGKIDINRANAEQLDGLKGIGPAKAQAIVADREKNGKFSGVDDLLRVKGIGEKLLSSMKESVVALP